MAMLEARVRHLTYCFIAFLILSSIQSNAQYEQDLKIQQQELNDKINQSNQYLSQVRETKSNTLQELQVLKQNIADRTELVEVLKSRREEFDQEIDGICRALDSINVIKDSLNLEYYTIMAANYKRQLLVTPIHLIFSSESLAGLLTDNVHADQYKYHIDQKKADYDQMENVSTTLLQSYEAAIRQNEQQQHRVAEEEGVIEQQLAEQESLIKELQEQENTIKAELQESRVYQENVNQRIASLISNDVSRAAVSRPTQPATPRPQTQTRTNPAISSNSVLDTRSIPVNGTIISKFGRHRHPSLPDVFIVNNGIDFAFSGSQQVKAVSAGVITKIEHTSGGSLILVNAQDGRYYVYSSLSNLNVKEGQSVSRGQSLGQASGELHFEIWDGKRKIDPEAVIRR